MPYASPQTVKWEYRVQRLGFVCFIAITLAAVFGLLGNRARVVASPNLIVVVRGKRNSRASS